MLADEAPPDSDGSTTRWLLADKDGSVRDQIDWGGGTNPQQPCRCKRSALFKAEARTRMRTSFDSGLGRMTVRRSKTSGPPGRLMTAASIGEFLVKNSKVSKKVTIPAFVA